MVEIVSISGLHAMIVNVIYGIPHGVLISIVKPDLDLRLFIPTPILLIVGLYLARNKFSS